MQYLLLIYEAEEIWESKTPEEQGEVIAQHQRMSDKMTADGVTFSGQALMPTSSAVCVKVKNGQKQLRDGPFAETKEQLGGFYLIDVETMEQAVEYAAMLPHAEAGTLEVRPVAVFD